MSASACKFWIRALFCLNLFIVPYSFAYAEIRTGAAATDIIGQYDQTEFPEPVITFNKNGDNDSPNRLGLRTPSGAAVDEVNHRLFLVDRGSNRILVYSLDAQNRPNSYFPTHVLGQPNFASSAAGSGASGLSSPRKVAYSPSKNVLFVADTDNHRVLAYNVESISNGEPAVAVFGQPDFSTTNSSVTSSGMGFPQGVALDDAGERLFVSMLSGNRVLVFDINEITNGEAAIHVLGRPDFTSSGSNPAPNDQNFSNPVGMAYDTTHGRLFVADDDYARVLVFDVNSIVNNENATQVICQASFVTSGTSASANGCGFPQDVTYDAATDRLFVSDYLYNRVQVFLNADPGSLVSGVAASATLGQTSTSGSSSGTSQTQLFLVTGLAFAASSPTLYVTEAGNERVMVFDVATATTNEPAINLLGQYDESSYESPVVTYDKSGAHNSPNLFGLGGFYNSVALDAVRHRLFVVDGTNNRVLVLNLNEQNELVSRAPIAVLGQPDFATAAQNLTQAGFGQPQAAVYDSTRDRLFVSDTFHNRILVFDTTTVTTGQPAAFVLGQTDFISLGFTVTQTAIGAPKQLALDEVNQRLFVAQKNLGRVTVFDVSTITNGEPAIAVLGKPDFTTAGFGAVNATNINEPYGLAYDPQNKRLFVSDSSDHRVLVFDVATITNGEAATGVLCQGLFNSNSDGLSASACLSPQGLAYDGENDALYVADRGNNRVLAFHVADVSNGEEATRVLGQSDFTSSSFTPGATKIGNPDMLSLDSTQKRLFVGGYAYVLMFPTRYSFDPSGETFTESAANDGTVSSTVDITLTGDKLPPAWPGPLTRDVHYTITGMPAGLTEVVMMNTRSSLTLSFTGAATAHESTDSTTNVRLTFLDAALSTVPASEMSGSLLKFTISFNDAATPTPPPGASICFGGVLPKPTIKIKGTTATVTLPAGITASAACSIKAQATTKKSKKPKSRAYKVGSSSAKLSKLRRGRWTFAYQVTTTALGTAQVSAKKGAKVK